MHENQTKSVHFQSEGLGLLQTMKQIRWKGIWGIFVSFSNMGLIPNIANAYP